MRDLLGVTVDVADLLPSDGGDFGFDNIATALTTSPLLLERYLTAGLRIAELAVGDAGAEPGTATFTISTVVTQNQHVEGLPLGTRGGIVVPHTFPADGEYVFSGRLLKTVAEGLVGVEGHETPHNFIVTIDGKQVFSAPIGGKADHEAAKENTPVPREEFDKRMTSPRIKVDGGAARGGIHLRRAAAAGTERVAAGRCAPARRRTTPPGMPRLRNAIIEGPYNADRRRRVGVAAEAVRLHAAKRRAQEAPCAERILSTVARRAFRRPVAKADIDAPLGALPRGAGGGRRLRRRHSRRPRADSDQPVVPVPLGARPGGACPTARRIGSPNSSWRAGCRSSSGAASRTTSC